MPDDLTQQLIKLFKIDLFAFDARGMDTGSVYHVIANRFVELAKRQTRAD